MDRCPRHPEQDTMVPCMECGRYFCRLCEPPRGAGQSCARCYQKSIEQLEKKDTGGAFTVARFLKRKPAKKTDNAGAALKDGAATAPVVKPETEMTPAKAAAGAPEKKPAKPVSPAKPAKVRKNRAAALKKRMKADWSATVSALGAAVKSTGRWFGGIGESIWSFLKERFPLALVESRPLEEGPPWARAWWRMLLIAVATIAVWSLVAIYSQQRYGIYSWVAAAIIAFGVVWAMGSRVGITVGLVSLMVGLLALGVGELLIQALYKAGTVKYMDIVADPRVLQAGNRPDMLILSNLIFNRLIPSAIILFFIGWWPIPLRISWRGFSSRIPVYSGFPRKKTSSRTRKAAEAE